MGKKILLKKGLACVVTAVVMATAMPAEWNGTISASAQSREADAHKNVVTDLSFLKPYDDTWWIGESDPSNDVSTWPSDYKIYFGEYNDEAVPFRVTKQSDGKLMIDCHIPLENVTFNSDTSKGNDYATSDVRTWLNTTYYNTLSLQEQAAILPTDLPASTETYTTKSSRKLPCEEKTALTGEKVFLLTAKEADLYRSSITSMKGDQTTIAWYTRSSIVDTTDQIAVGRSNFYIERYDINSGYTYCRVSPAMNLDLSDICFVTPSNTDKASTFTTLGETTSRDWNLTLAGGTGFTAAFEDGQSTAYARAGETLNINVASLGTNISGGTAANGYYSQISAMFFDENGELFMYGKVKDSAATGNIAIQLPETLEEGTYTLKVFAEKVNSSATSNRTDYASNMVSLNVTIAQFIPDNRTVKTVNLNSDGSIAGIVRPTVFTTNASWEGSKVYFGSYDGSPQLFRVLHSCITDYSADGKTKTMFLDSDNVVKEIAFRADTEAEDRLEWNASDLRTWMNGTAADQYLYEFSDLEKNTIIASARTDSAGLKVGTGSNYTSLSGDKVFALDAYELQTPKYGYQSSYQRNKDYTTANKIRFYWARSNSGIKMHCIGMGSMEGCTNLNSPELLEVGYLVGYMGASPAMNLDLSKILFTMEASVNPYTYVQSQPIAASTANTWKVTLLDETKSSALTEGQKAYIKNLDGVDNMFIPYTYKGNDVTQLSVMITTDTYNASNAEVLYYGKLSTTATVEPTGGSGFGSFPIPTELQNETLGEDYHVYLLAETIRDGNYTNTASVPVEIAECGVYASVTITNPEGTKLVLRTQSGDGAEMQEIVGRITPIVYTTADGYYIPEDYVSKLEGVTDGTINGITVKRVSATQLELSGSVLKDVSLTLKPASLVQVLATPAISVDFLNETLTGFVSGASYEITGTANSLNTSTMTIALSSDDFGKTVSVKRVCGSGEKDAYTDSALQTIVIPARPAKPSVTSAAETVKGAKDGKISGVSSKMEYKLTSASTWNAVSEGVTQITGLTPGAYEVRIKATKANFKGTSVYVTIAQGKEADSSADSGEENTSSADTGNGSASSSGDSTSSADSASEISASDIKKALGVDAKTAKKIQNVAKKYNVSIDTIKITDKSIKAKKTDGDLKGSSFGKLKARVIKNNTTSVKLKWNKVKGADGYIIYGNRCNSGGKKYTYKKLKTLSKTKTTYTAKKLKKGTYYKFIVVAYKKVNGKKVTIASSVTMHTITKGGKYGVAKSVKITKIGTKKNTTKITLKKGKTAKIKAKEVKESKKIKQHRKLVYESSNTKIATVSKTGKIKAKKKGTCKIYVYAQNGVYKTITVTVK